MTQRGSTPTPPAKKPTPAPSGGAQSSGAKGMAGPSATYAEGAASVAPRDGAPPPERPSGGAGGLPPGPRGSALDAAVDHDAMAGPDGIQTWNPDLGGPGKGGFELAAPGDRANAGDKRNFKGIGAGDTRGKSIEAFQALNNGVLTMEQLKRLDPASIARINPIGDECSACHILKYACQQSWHVAKEQLAGSKDPKHHDIMRKLWEYRQWHFDDVLKQTQREVNTPETPKALERWPSAGSASLTSDIDVNLKGTDTERAVEVFNRLFKADGWAYESGVVYDVNVYALDFMHAFAGVETDKGLLVGKEGKREGNKVGGFETEKGSAEAKEDGAKKLAADSSDQEAWSLLKVRMYMNVAEWDVHKAAILPAEAGPKRTAKLATFALVEKRLKSYQATLRTKMNEMAGENAVASPDADASKHGVGQVGADAAKIGHKKAKPHEDEHTVGEDAQMAASNRIYEQKLTVIAGLRKAVAKTIASYNSLVAGGDIALAELMEKKIHADLANLRTKLSEASLYSNEAYITDGAINHTVVGLQGKKEVRQTHTESMNAVNENHGDSLKEISRHSKTIGEAAYKAGKYMWRMCDAARNMGVKNDEIDALYKVGHLLGNDIKSRGGDVEANSAAEIAKPPLGISDVSSLAALVTKIARDVQKAYDAMPDGHEQELGAAVKKDVH